MVITVEPGIYVPPLPQYPKQFHGMGVRIEDEVLVGKSHATILSVDAPKEVKLMEACLIGHELISFQGGGCGRRMSGTTGDPSAGTGGRAVCGEAGNIAPRKGGLGGRLEEARMFESRQLVLMISF
jgi:hypothetical protein